MRIGINGNPLLYSDHCGTKHYAEELLKALFLIDKKNIYIVYTLQPLHLLKNPRVINRIYSTSRSSLFRKKEGDLNYLVKKDRIDVFHNLDPYSSIFLTHKNMITTVHDTYLNNIFSISKNDVLERINCEIRRYFVFNRTKVFISVSRSTYQEVEKFKKQKQSHFVIYEGISKLFTIVPNTKKNRILAFADFSLRKNIFNVIRAWEILPRQLKLDYTLTIILSSDIIKNRIIKILRHKGLLDEVDIFVNISTEELISIYNQSVCLVYPSLYEGFGLPILEAMACGCPVITTNYGSMKEVAGNAALLINPLSHEYIADAIKIIIRDDDTRNNLIKRGKIRSSYFSWNKTAKETLKIYSEVVRKGG